MKEVRRIWLHHGSSELIRPSDRLRFAAFPSGSSRHNRPSTSVRAVVCLHQSRAFRCLLLDGLRRPPRVASLLPCETARNHRTAAPPAPRMTSLHTVVLHVAQLLLLFAPPLPAAGHALAPALRPLRAPLLRCASSRTPPPVAAWARPACTPQLPRCRPAPAPAPHSAPPARSAPTHAASSAPANAARSAPEPPRRLARDYVPTRLCRLDPPCVPPLARGRSPPPGPSSSARARALRCPRC
jgi:hypothetical protein